MIDDEVMRLLHARADAVRRRLASLETDEQSLLRDRADATADDEHDPEGSTLSGEWARVDVLRRSALAETASIEAALQRADAGTFGVCATCGRDIPRERLLVRPESPVCVSCAV